MYTTDQEVLDKIAIYLFKDVELKKWHEQVHHQDRFVGNFDGYEGKVICKSRAIDPLFFDGAEIKRISEIQSDWKSRILEEVKPKTYYLHYIA